MLGKAVVGEGPGLELYDFKKSGRSSLTLILSG